MRLRTFVVDDEPLAVELIASYVRKTPFLTLEGTYNSASSAFKAVQENPVDLIFCDIQMPEMSGVEFSKILPKDTKVIFTTAFSQYAVEGFRVNALDYLLKPVSYDAFLSAAKRAIELFELKGQVSAATPEKQSIIVKSEYKLQQIALDSIPYIEGMKDYVKIHLTGGADPVVSLMSLRQLEETLPSDRFIRVHRSYIVQPSKITTIEKNRIIFGNSMIPISDNCRDAFYTFLASHAIML